VEITPSRALRETRGASPATRRAFPVPVRGIIGIDRSWYGGERVPCLPPSSCPHSNAEGLFAPRTGVFPAAVPEAGRFQDLPAAG
jgi:hypothetical protein